MNSIPLCVPSGAHLPSPQRLSCLTLPPERGRSPPAARRSVEVVWSVPELFHQPCCSGVPWPHAWRAFELGTTTTHRHHQSGTRAGAQGAGASGVELTTIPPRRPDQPLGCADRTTSRQVRRDSCGGPQTCRCAVRNVARRGPLRALPPTRVANDDLAGRSSEAFQTLPVLAAGREPSNGCPETVSAARAVRVPRPQAQQPCACDCTPSTDCHLCASSADNRLRQPAACSLTSRAPSPLQPEKTAFGRRPSLTARPPHSCARVPPSAGAARAEARRNRAQEDDNAAHRKRPPRCPSSRFCCYWGASSRSACRMSCSGVEMVFGIFTRARLASPSRKPRPLRA